MKNILKIIIVFWLTLQFCNVLTAQTSDTTSYQNYVNTNIVTNGTRSITATHLNYSLLSSMAISQKFRREFMDSARAHRLRDFYNITANKISDWNTVFNWYNSNPLSSYAFSNGSNASGTWGIDISGNASTASNATNTTQWNYVTYNGSVYSSGTPTYVMAWDGSNYRPVTQAPLRDFLGLGSYAYRSGGLAELTGANYTGELYVANAIRQRGYGQPAYIYVEGNAGGGGVTNPIYREGFSLSWNRSNGQGESSIIWTNSGGGTNPRFQIGYWNNSSIVEQLSINQSGEVNIPSTLTASRFSGILSSGYTTSLNAAWTVPPTSTNNGIAVFRYNQDAIGDPASLDNANYLINIYSHQADSVAPYGHQIAGSNNGRMFIRNVSNGSFGSWLTMLTSGNINEFALPLTGGTVSGNISATSFTGSGSGLTGTASGLTAGAVDWSGVTNKPASFTPSTHTHTWSDVTGKPNLQNGTFSPTYSNLDLCTAAATETNSQWFYTVVGNVVTVTGVAYITTTSANLNSSFQFTLPLTANSSFPYYGTGHVSAEVLDVGGNSYNADITLISTTRAKVTYRANYSGTTTLFISFSYTN